MIVTEHDLHTAQFITRCTTCGETLHTVTEEAVRSGPRRTSGSSELIPLLAAHKCKGPTT